MQVVFAKQVGFAAFRTNGAAPFVEGEPVPEADPGDARGLGVDPEPEQACLQLRGTTLRVRPPGPGGLADHPGLARPTAADRDPLVVQRRAGHAPALADGTETASVAQFPAKMGSLGVQAAFDAASGKTFEKSIDTGTEMVTKDNFADFQ